MATDPLRVCRAKTPLNAFTLVELLAVIAILSILVAVALPAYNNYTTKSKFTEVVLATAPTKTAIVACAETGDCVSGGSIYLSMGASGSGATAPSAATTNLAYSMSPFFYGGNSTAAMNSMVQSSLLYAADDYAAQGAYITGMGIAMCLSYGGSVISYTCIPQSSYNADLAAIGNQTGFTSAMDGYLGIPSTPASPAADIPCVGASSTGCSPSTKYVASVSYDQNGDIYGTAVSGSSGLNGEQFVLQPSYSSGRVDWTETGSCKTRAGGAIC
jgi:type IV pilus assembly protein PilA